MASRPILLVVYAAVITVTIVIGRSFFQQSNECLTPDEIAFDDLPYASVIAMLEQQPIDPRSTMMRLTEAEMEMHISDVMGYIRTPEFRNRVHQRIGYVPEITTVVGRAYRTGDHANWFYGGNLTPGRKHTGILQVNIPFCNTARFEYRQPCTGEVSEITGGVGNMILFPSNKLYHRITEEIGGMSCTRFDIVFEFVESTWVSLARKTVHDAVTRLKLLAFK